MVHTYKGMSDSHTQVRTGHQLSPVITFYLTTVRRYLTEQEAHCLGHIGWPASSQDLLVSAPHTEVNTSAAMVFMLV